MAANGMEHVYTKGNCAGVDVSVPELGSAKYYGAVANSV